METLTNVENLANSNGNNTFSAIDNRIESVDDKEVNKALFKIYEALIPKLSRLEQLWVEGCALEISSNKEAYKYHLNKIIVTIPVATLLLFIPYFILLIILPDSISDIILAIMPEDFLPTELLILSILIVLAILQRIYFVKTRDKKIKDSKEKMEIVLQEFALIEDEVSAAIMLVPPKYRDSASLSLIVEAYVNTHADNLKEAVNYCSKELNAKEIQSMMASMSATLSQISYQQLETQSQLSAIRRDVWISNILG